jgi:hemerythrin
MNNLQLILDDAEQHFGHEEKLFNAWKYLGANAHAQIYAHALMRTSGH